MRLIKNNAIRMKIESIFNVLFLIYLFLGVSNPTYGTHLISFVMYPTFILGGSLVIWRLVLSKRFIRTIGLPWLVLILLSYVFSSLMNFRYLNKNSIVIFILWTFYFLLVFTKDPDRSSESIAREFHFISSFYLICVTALTLISAWMFLTGYSVSYRDPNNANYEVASGFFAGRLWGAFQDPNLGAVMCDIAIVISVYFIWYIKKKALKVFLCIDIVIMLLYIALSDSRNGMVTLGCLSAFSLFFCSFRKLGKEIGSKIIFKKALCIIASAVVFVCGFIAPKLIQTGYNAIIRTVYSEDDDIYNNVLVDRGYDLKEDVSNRRLDIWKSGIEIALSKPLTGVSFVGLTPYAKENIPDSYIVSNDIWEFNTLDNDYLNLFAAQGIPGVVLMLALAITVIRRIFSGIWYAKKDDFPIIFNCTVIVCSLAVSAMFQGTMFYQQTPNTMMFWNLLGSAVYLLSLTDENKSTNHIYKITSDKI